jgi:hypothetical protein
MSTATKAANLARETLHITIANMPSQTPLRGRELVDCARANAKQGIETAAYQCGYGDDLNTFAQQLRLACEQMNLQVKELSELIADQDLLLNAGTGEIIAPDTTSQL